MPKPNIQKSEPSPGNPNQPPARIIEIPPASTVAGAVAASKRAVDQANKAR
jgi:hypothetical protein